MNLSYLDATITIGTTLGSTFLLHHGADTLRRAVRGDHWRPWPLRGATHASGWSPFGFTRAAAASCNGTSFAGSLRLIFVTHSRTRASTSCSHVSAELNAELGCTHRHRHDGTGTMARDLHIPQAPTVWQAAWGGACSPGRRARSLTFERSTTTTTTACGVRCGVMGTLISSRNLTPPPSSQMCAISFTLLVVLLRRPKVYSSATVGFGLSSTVRHTRASQTAQVASGTAQGGVAAAAPQPWAMARHVRHAARRRTYVWTCLGTV